MKIEIDWFDGEILVRELYARLDYLKMKLEKDSVEPVNPESIIEQARHINEFEGIIDSVRIQVRNDVIL